MRLQRSPSAMVAVVSRDSPASSSSPVASHDEAIEPARDAHTRIELSPNAKLQATRMGGAIGGSHPVRHARHLSTVASASDVSMHELAQPKEVHHKQETHGEQELHVTHPHRAAVIHSRPVSYATQAYREFLASATNSVATSAASSAAQSRQSSRSSSGYSSQTISGQSSRTTSPASKREERQEHAGHVHHPTHVHAHNHSAHYVEAHFPQATTTTTTTTSVTQQVSTLSFSNLKRSDSQESLDEIGVSHEKPQPRLRPQHFTFTESDIMKSFLKAAERDRARAEREERAREAQQRAEMEQEYERKKQLLREQAARELAYQSSSRFETVGDSLSDSSPDSAPTRRRRRFPPIPAHFKFSTHDVIKSAAKPSQRQNIGHWTTFPRSSTIMLPADQLRGWIRGMIADQQAEMQRQSQMHVHAHRKQASAPNSPSSNGLHSNGARSHTGSNGVVGSSTARLPVRSHSRRASLPSAYAAQVRGTGKSESIPVRATHGRSISYSHERLAKVAPLDKAALNRLAENGNSTDKASSTSFRRGSFDGQRAHGFERTSLSSSLQQKPVRGVPLASQASVAQATAAAIDAATRRAQMLQARHHHGQAVQQRPHSGSEYSMHASTASAPSSHGASPTRSHGAGALLNGRSVKSTHASPSRVDHRRGLSNGALTPQQRAHGLAAQQQYQYTPQPPVGRKASLGGEAKVASAHNSPNVQGRSLINGVDSNWQVAYDKSLNDAYSHANGLSTAATAGLANGHTKHLHSLYKDVPSSGYGQRIR